MGGSGRRGMVGVVMVVDCRKRGVPAKHLELFVALARRATLLVAGAQHVLLAVRAVRRTRPLSRRPVERIVSRHSHREFLHPFSESAEVGHEGLPSATLRPRWPTDEPCELLGVGLQRCGREALLCQLCPVMKLRCLHLAQRLRAPEAWVSRCCTRARGWVWWDGPQN